MPKRLAIAGCGSSGLITLKYALEALPDWECVAFEQSTSIAGCWGRPPSGFVSTSTKYTTQFACFPQYDALVRRDLSTSDAGSRYPEFFCDGEYGDYLEKFASHFGLHPFIQRHTTVLRMEPEAGGKWKLCLRRHRMTGGQPGRDAVSEDYASEVAGDEELICDAVVVCTGLADRPKSMESEVPVLDRMDSCDSIRDRRIVVIGGGESAVDLARRLARPELNNKLWLSVRHGMRVSPRYHPIRGVPSDFLRNRLLMSFDSGLRNAIGQKFVEFRMRYQKTLESMFPARRQLREPEQDAGLQARSQWSWRLTKLARDDLFNMYHNKSDDFLADVASGRIIILGGNSDASCRRYFQFDSSTIVDIDPDLIVPAIGYQSSLKFLTDGKVELEDFYLGVRHVDHQSLFAVGFTRPIIGNIPSISEMQACYITGLLSGRFGPGADLKDRHRRQRCELERRYSSLDTNNVYPVEMFPYCDQLAREMGCYPGWRKARSLARHVRTLLAPATTLHYFPGRNLPSDGSPIYTPHLLTVLLLMIKPLDWLVRLARLTRNAIRQSPGKS